MSKKDKNWHQFKEEHESKKSPKVEHSEDAVDLPEEIEHLEPSLDHPSYVELSEKLTLAEQQSHENWEKAVRAQAELDNVRRRAEREIENALRYGVKEKLITDLLPVIDSLEQALQLAAKAEDASMHEGLELTLKLFMDVLKKFEVQQIDPTGAPFDPQLHEAMSMQVAPDAEPNTVLAVFQKGYKLSDRVIRPARVVVSKK
ncbi:nucleotide exchange factor GrpE [Legionella anisa]|uniref:Protein GrpE n=1 Tax=Legionella anisa TaxID=28082 RepID=A0AAX0WQN9_9GAMM|nr:nucleotide exchange factor GrpE [Legionella anisa]AWN75053.1 nucleotide exchange factor GrpE [Legionella anisa]KTC69241.1 Heat-shock protein GrpE(HSP-70 cofactor) [Legionella anisa]MCW8424741.1 nucleotide exchange factor GrpE [Legionella anisa]MCW8446140.1 nucleotide exchange factor GrpE [Legionella anisa]PNL60992.1 nucleotide exchange factor GrpE [Legionella anisa]